MSSWLEQTTDVKVHAKKMEEASPLLNEMRMLSVVHDNLDGNTLLSVTSAVPAMTAISLMKSWHLKSPIKPSSLRLRRCLQMRISTKDYTGEGPLSPLSWIMKNGWDEVEDERQVLEYRKNGVCSDSICARSPFQSSTSPEKKGTVKWEWWSLLAPFHPWNFL